MKIPGLLVLLSGLFFLSCSTSKKVVKSAGPVTYGDVVKALEGHNQSFSWFHGKATARVKTSSESQTVQVVIRMARDSAIWLQVKKFEVEAARMLVTPQEYILLNRLESTYQQKPLDQVREMAGMNIGFDEMQQWLFGNIILPGSDSMEIQQDQENVHVLFDLAAWKVHYTLDKTNLRVQRANVSDGSGKDITIEFDDYKKTNAGFFLAHDRTIFFPEEPGVHGEIRMEFSEMEINVAKELKFVLPSHYREIE